ncbi:ParB/RepB/Spo0J family partition protein [Pseudoduganella sp. R-34]|jgi:ParB family transcriptional regulator, chromosome partitioning protein|uniref:ParB/RepB/Spo0J family partition protein n=1 Tax=Pseudoduganella sp. R-34 TaxID=3404062 RepID=UPI003CF75F65
MTIKKKDMASRAAAAAAATPALSDRFAHARAHAPHNPAAVDREVVAPIPVIPEATPPAQAHVSFTEKTDGSLKLVDLDQIVENPFNARRVYLPTRIAELAASIGTHGQDIPGIATIRNGKYVLAAGHYRFKALSRINKPMLLLIKPGLTDRQLYEISYRENQEREDQTTLDNALSWRDLLDRGIYTSETDLATATNISLPSINKTMATLNLKEEVLSIVREHPADFGISIIYELVLLQDVADIEVVVDAANGSREGRLSRDGITEIRKKLEVPKPGRRPKQTSRIYKIQQEGRAIGSMKTWDSGKVSLEVTLLDPNERHELITELQARFKLAD